MKITIEITSPGEALEALQALQAFAGTGTATLEVEQETVTPEPAPEKPAKKTKPLASVKEEPKAPEPVKEEPKAPEPVKEEPKAPEPVKEEPTAKAPTLDEIRTLMSAKIQNGNIDKIKEKISSYGAANLSGIKPENYSDFYNFLNSL